MSQKSTMLIALLSVTSTVLAGCQGRGTVSASAARSSQPITMQTCIVAATDAPRTLDATGTVTAQYSADLGTRTTARVAAVAVKEGDLVHKGQLLISLDASDIDASITQAAATIRSASAQYQSALAAANMAVATSAAQIETAQAQVEQARSALEAAVAKRDLVQAGARPQERAEAVQNTAHASANLTLARKTYDRMATLYKQYAITGQQFDAAKSDLDGAQAAYQSALEQQNMVDEGSRVEDKAAAQAAVEQAQASLDAARAGLVQARAAAQVVSVRRADVRQAQAQIGNARAALGVAQANRSYSSIVAPFDGVVTQRLADPGSMAGPGVPLLRIEGGDLHLDAVVPESALNAVHPGSSLAVSLDALGNNPLPATVISIAPQGDATSHTFLVKARLPQGSTARAGMFGRLHIVTGVDRTLTIPSSALVSRDGLSFVYVIQNSTARLRLVSTSAATGERVSVLSGLQSGDIVAASTAGVIDNARVALTK